MLVPRKGCSIMVRAAALRIVGLGLICLLAAACGTTGNSVTRLDYPVRIETAAAPAPPRQLPPAQRPRLDPAPRGNEAVQKIGRPYEINGRWYAPAADPDYDETGIASWYGDAFHGKPTANGEIFDMNAVSAAHTTLPLPSVVEVTNLDNGRTLIVRINDRGPFVDGRIIDLSRAAAEELGVRQAGLARVRVRYLGPGPADWPSTAPVQYARAAPAPPPAAPPSPPTAAPAAPPERFEVQAGAFSQFANAERAAQIVSTAGVPEIRPTQIGGATYYRVMVIGLSGESEAFRALNEVAASGFPDARIVRP